MSKEAIYMLSVATVCVSGLPHALSLIPPTGRVRQNVCGGWISADYIRESPARSIPRHGYVWLLITPNPH